ncbi:MAG: serine/threonine-protein kinase [Oscillatoria sp. PMC 1051.18]|nr:serine/threonine-protein kinase [Oscillatoria sp. PMC 1050.18]MEC5033078.1 serine/threonine-protein kinase [Oscillatoria sp. PMC 1051.18]
MEIICTRPGCPKPLNNFSDLDDESKLKTAQQKYCTSCGMPLILAGRYLPSRLLGRGGFGAAFLARDRYTPTMRFCVVKQFQPAGNLSSRQLEIAQNLFSREAEVLERLGSEHPQIPDLYAFFPLIVGNGAANSENQFFYLVQQFIDGQDLEKELQAKGKFSEAEVREVLESILNVLQFVHEHNSIHRDIKPSNIMRDRSGRLYLLDFGAVKQVTAGAGTPTPSRSTGIFSMGFAPPEQMIGSRVYPSTDLYALAATCVNLLTGKDFEELYHDDRWNWRLQAPGVSDSLAEIFDRMLQHNPSDRYSSAQEVIDALQNHSITPTPLPPQPSPDPAQSTAVVNPSPQAASVQSANIPQTPQSVNPSQASSPVPPSQQQGRIQQQPSGTPARRRFSLLDILLSAAFTGFEAGLLFFALGSLLPSPGISIGLLGAIVGGLIFVQYRRIIEGKDLPIIAIITLALMLIPGLRGGFGIQFVLIAGIFTAAATVAVTALFRLIYKLLSAMI